MILNPFSKLFKSRHSTGLLSLLVLAVLGYVMLTVPPHVMEGYKTAQGLGTWVGYVYLGVVGFGTLILVSLLTKVGYSLYKNRLLKKQARDRRAHNPSELSSKELRHELDANLTNSREYAEEKGVSPLVRQQIDLAIQQLQEKRAAQRLEIVAFGTISSGKSSLLNALAGRDVFKSNIIGGTTVTKNEIPWPDNDRVILVDTPGLAEVHGENHATLAASIAEDADIVLLVIDGPLKSYELDLLRQLATMEKRIIVCLNKHDWYDTTQRNDLIEQIAEQTTSLIQPTEIVAVQSLTTRRPRVRILSDGTQIEELVPVPPDIAPLADRLLAIVNKEGQALLLANLLMQSRGLVEDAKERVLAALDQQADELITKHMWAAGGVTALNPFPLLDIAGGSAITVKMVIELAQVYKQNIDTDTVMTLLGQLGKNLIAFIGVSAAVPAITSALGSMLKTVPGIGTIAGGLLQGTTQAIVTRWIGKVFCEYYRNEMQPPPGGLAELAKEKWREVTQPEELRKLIISGRTALQEKLSPNKKK